MLRGSCGCDRPAVSGLARPCQSAGQLKLREVGVRRDAAPAACSGMSRGRGCSRCHGTGISGFLTHWSDGVRWCKTQLWRSRSVGRGLRMKRRGYRWMSILYKHPAFSDESEL